MAAWTREYHERTKHTPLSVRTSGGRLDWYNQPLPFKLYPTVEPLDLPVELPESGLGAVAVLSGDAAPERPALDLPQLARLLFFSAGVVRRLGRGAAMRFFRAAPAAGALYPVEIYVVCADLPGLRAGVHHFGPIDFTLRTLREGDHRALLAEAAAEPSLAARPATLVLTGIPWRTTWKYRERGYRHLFWDAGTILANTLALAASAGMEPRIVGGFVDAAVSALLDVAPPEEMPLALVALGAPTAPPAALSPPPGSLDLPVVPLSPNPVRYPAVEAAHAAGNLADATAVAAWRTSAGASPPAAATRGASAPAPADAEEADETIEQVILRRGSTRRFDHGSLPGALLTWTLAVASRPVDADFVAPGGSLVRSLVAAHAVDAIEPGAYAWADGELRLLHRDVSRARTAFLCLEQALGGDSAATVFHVSDLETVLARLGDRGYRMAQLEAGIACGRLHLAAYSHRFGASGLTFYDDDVRDYFQTTEEPMLVTAIGRPAYRSRPGRRPSELPPVRLAIRP